MTFVDAASGLKSVVRMFAASAEAGRHLFLGGPRLADVLKFCCYLQDKQCLATNLRGAYLVGIDGVPARGDLRIEKNVIACEPRSQEALALSVQWPVGPRGATQLQTTRLPPRDEPYNLHIELARHRLMAVSIKREEWGLYDYPGLEETNARLEESRALFVAALEKAEDPAEAARLADQSLALAIEASEEMCRFHASIFLNRRRQAGGLTGDRLGVCSAATTPRETLLPEIGQVLDFVRVPFIWRDIQPSEKAPDYDRIDAWLAACREAHLSLRGGPLLNFGIQFVPDWMYAWENDYEAIVGFARQHVQRTVQRYAGQIDTWVVASGLHAETVFPFTFEQIIDLTRLAVNVTKQAAPRCRVVLDLMQPWGEYFVRSQRTAPPLLYAEMAVQSGIPFDAFGVQLVFGLDSDGYHLRDMLQISSLIDRLASLGKPLHITAAAVPSDAAVVGCPNCTWDEQGQAAWLGLLGEIALSKPYVESVCFETLSDRCCTGVPTGGLVRADGSAKPALARLAELRKAFAAGD